MSRSEAGRLGAIASRHTLMKHKEGRVLLYEQQPSVCRNCGVALDYSHRMYIFCGSSCSAKYNNKMRERKITFCLNCGAPKKTPAGKYCSAKCSGAHRQRVLMEKWLSGETNGGNILKPSAYVKKYLKERYGVKCSICGISEWCGKEVPLVLDHKDGNPTNNSEGNLRLICGNCDMQTPTYKGKNKGHGRWERVERYRQGKSY